MTIQVHPLLSGHRLKRSDTFHQFSTNETFTGDYWIDGKKIYEKTIHTGALITGMSEHNHGVNNFGTLISAGGIAIQGSIGTINMIPEPCIDATPTYGTSLRDIDSRCIRTLIGTGYTGAQRITEAYITMYYTKTT